MTFCMIKGISRPLLIILLLQMTPTLWQLDTIPVIEWNLSPKIVLSNSFKFINYTGYINQELLINFWCLMFSLSSSSLPLPWNVLFLCIFYIFLSIWFVFLVTALLNIFSTCTFLAWQQESSLIQTSFSKERALLMFWQTVPF